MVSPRQKPLCSLLLVGLTVTLAGCGSFSVSPSGTPTAVPSQTSDSPTNGVHGTTYPVKIKVTVSIVNSASALNVETTTLSSANLTQKQRTEVITAIEADEPVTWSGQSDETPPTRIRILVAASDRLPPTVAERNPAEAWRVARETTGYVIYQNTTYKLQMVKIAP